MTCPASGRTGHRPAVLVQRIAQRCSVTVFVTAFIVPWASSVPPDFTVTEPVPGIDDTTRMVREDPDRWTVAADAVSEPGWTVTVTDAELLVGSESAGVELLPQADWTRADRT